MLFNYSILRLLVDIIWKDKLKVAMEVKKSLKPVNYIDAMNFLESRIIDVYREKKKSFYGY